MIDVDRVTQLISRAIDALHLGHQVQTIAGVVVAAIFWCATIVFQLLGIVDFTAVPWWQWVFAGVLLSLVIALLRRRPIKTEHSNDAIQVIKDGPFTEAERHRMFMELFRDVLKKIADEDKPKDE